MLSTDARLACLEQIVDSLNEGVLVSDHEGRIILYNKAQEKLEGLKSEHVIGKYLWEAYNYNPEMSEHRRVFTSGQPVIAQYRAHAHINGIPQYVTYSTYPIIHNGETIGVLSISHNETKLKNLLHETIELKRKIVTQNKGSKEPSNGTTYSFESIKGSSSVLRSLIKEAQNVAMHDTDILIVGETGTGKELFAQSIHNHSKRAKSPFVAINCAAIPETLLESTLFGTIKGSYTGAGDQMGLFEYAQDGTLFLDEINSMPISLQSKLIRVLEERMVRRVGANAVTPVRCTVISASNEAPKELIAQSKLRSDLYYRIARTCLIIPPLRERKEDVLFLIDYFIHLSSKQLNKNVHGLTERLYELFLQYKWPGNIRELHHVIENLIIRADEGQKKLDINNLPAYLRENMFENNLLGSSRKSGNRRPLKTVTTAFEENFIRNVLEQADWNITKAAEKIGTTRQSLQYHIKKLNIRR
ncbi:sigma-54 interaction domain-containing protein [Brevibacillus sp. NRS-1366]|uniref:sigma-54 interaction domain-containing protein n=1 Tax=Brevibacillus sp. NRS-1366 TaxID=3233899 RepID=UPI003D227DF4